MAIPSIDEMEYNLMEGFKQVTPRQRIVGCNWYPIAHDWAYVIGHGNIVMGAGLLAATSPNKGWNDNRRIAVNAGLGIFGGQVTNALDKARAIYAGADPETVLPMHKKTGHFYRNILDPSDPDWVTIDRHAIRAATLDWDNGEPRVTDKGYRDIVSAFKAAAWRCGVHPCAFQAMLWGWARER